MDKAIRKLYDALAAAKINLRTSTAVLDIQPIAIHVLARDKDFIRESLLDALLDTFEKEEELYAKPGEYTGTTMTGLIDAYVMYEHWLTRDMKNSAQQAYRVALLGSTVLESWLDWVKAYVARDADTLLHLLLTELDKEEAA